MRRVRIIITNSFHTLPGGNSAGTRLTADQLQMNRGAAVDIGGGVTVTLFDGWSSNSWNFGTASQFPALRGYKERGGSPAPGDLLCDQPAATHAQCSP